MHRVISVVAHYTKEKKLSHTEIYLGELNAQSADCGEGMREYVKCDDCDKFMEFIPGATVIDGFFRCPICGATVTEDEILEVMDKENDKIGPMSRFRTN